MEQPVDRDVGRWLLTWAGASVPFTALAAGLVLAIQDLTDDGPPVPFSGGWVGMFIFGSLFGGVWSLVAMFPRYFLLLLWPRLCRSFGEMDQSRALILVGMVLFSLPEALLVRALAARVTDVFLVAWASIAVGLFLPRLLFGSLRAGVFSD
jgi:hypothetical protein